MLGAGLTVPCAYLFLFISRFFYIDFNVSAILVQFVYMCVCVGVCGYRGFLLYIFVLFYRKKERNK